MFYTTMSLLQPTSILQCVNNDGELNMYKLFQLHHYNDETRKTKLQCFLDINKETLDHFVPEKVKHHCSAKGVLEYYDEETGTVKSLTPKQSVWYQCYVSSPSLTAKFYHRFRKKFRLLYKDCLAMVEDAEEEHWLPSRFGGRDACGKEGAPVSLLLLGVFHYLGHGLMFDDLEEYTAISAETHQTFF